MVLRLPKVFLGSPRQSHGSLFTFVELGCLQAQGSFLGPGEAQGASRDPWRSPDLGFPRISYDFLGFPGISLDFRGFRRIPLVETQ